MIENMIVMIKEVGFPVVICLILMYDKLKTNGSMLKVVENNNRILRRVEQTMKGGITNGK